MEKESIHLIAAQGVAHTCMAVPCVLVVVVVVVIEVIPIGEDFLAVQITMPVYCVFGIVGVEGIDTSWLYTLWCLMGRCYWLMAP